jgi:hypothetical protein
VRLGVEIRLDLCPGRGPAQRSVEAMIRLCVGNPLVGLVIWASPRELLNVFHADPVGCDIITVMNDLLAKLSLVWNDLQEYSLDTVQMFRDDAVRAGYRLEPARRRTP